MGQIIFWAIRPLQFNWVERCIWTKVEVSVVKSACNADPGCMRFIVIKMLATVHLQLVHNSTFMPFLSTLDGVKMEMILFAYMTHGSKRPGSSMSDSHTPHMLTGMTKQSTTAFASHHCWVCLLSEFSVWDGWAAVIYSAAIYSLWHLSVLIMTVAVGTQND